MTPEGTAPFPVDGGAGGAAERLAGPRIPVPEAVVARARALGATVDLSPEGCGEAGRDWWPVGIGWAAGGKVPARPGAVVRPTSAEAVAGILAACSAARVPVTPAAGRSGVCGGAVPVFGGVALDCSGLTGEIVLDEQSLVAEVPAGTNGRVLEDALRGRGAGYTLGHWPQSIDLSTVGGWLACRSAGQYSTRYGKIEDMVAGLEVAHSDGRLVRTGTQAPRSASGPTLTQLFVGSEGTLGVITRAWLRVRPVPAAESRRAFDFASLDAGMDACRCILRRGATPAVLRLYDPVESERIFGGTDGSEHPEGSILLVLDEADPALVAATMAIVDGECHTARRLDAGLVAHWLATRNDVSALGPLWQAGIVVDTAEVAGHWSSLGPLAGEVTGALREVPGTVVASVHLSHAYPEGGCLYFTFAGRSPDGGDGSSPGAERYYRQAWDALIAPVIRRGAAVSHHHGIGIGRARFLGPSLGSAHDLLVALKRALDPSGILNPGKLGIPSTFGEAPWP